MTALKKVPLPPEYKPRFLSGLRGRIAVVQLFFLLVIGVYLFAVWAPRATQDDLGDDMQVMENILHSVADGIAPLLMQGQTGNAAGNLDLMRSRQPDLVRIELLPPEGEKGAPFYPFSELPPLANDMAQPNRVLFTVPVQSFGVDLAQLRVVVDNSERIAAYADTQNRLAAVLIAAFVLLLGVSSILLDSMVYQPVARLATATDRMARGDYETRIRASRGEDEVAHLTRRVDYLREAIAAQQTDLRDALDRAQDASRTKSDFLATMSHEIRTPMNGVLGMASLILETDLDDVQRQCADSIKDCGESLLALINDILDFSKMEAGQFGLNHEPFNIIDIADTALTLVAPRARDNDLALSVEVAPDVPTYLMGDGQRLQQVLINLLGNAVKFTDSGTIRTSVKRVAGAGAELVEIAVRDSGIGIPADKQATLFDAFTQVDSASNRKYQGTGLGLAICRHLVELMGGSIGVQSQDGMGSCFYIRLPMEQAETLPPGASVWNSLDGAKKLSVLVVDDDPLGLHLLQTQLQAWVGRVDVATTAAEGLTALEQGSTHYDLLLSDHMMPGMNGLEFISHVRNLSADKQPGCIALISSASVTQMQEAHRSGLVDKVITRPMRHRDLRDLLALTIEGPQKREEPINTAAQVAATPLDGLVILLAEDNAVNQKVATAHLRKAGHTVIPVDNGSEAVEAMSQHKVDIILMDIQMPEMDGMEATRQIRAMQNAQSRVPIIALTANAMPGDRETFLDAGMDDYLSKPFKKPDLLAKLDHWAGQKSDRQVA